MIWSGDETVATGQEDAQHLQRERAPGAGRRVRGEAGRQVRRDDERSGPEEDRRARPLGESMREGVVGQRPIRLDRATDDLGHRVRADDVDPLEGGNDRALRRAE